MPKFYFTFGSEGQPYVGGWTEVEAPNLPAACTAFQVFHPDKTEGLLNCCSVYDEDQFKRTSMYGPGGNFGNRCWERITLKQEIVYGLGGDPNRPLRESIILQREFTAESEAS